MSRLRDGIVLGNLVGVLVVAMFLAPLDDPFRTVAYVLLVETPLVALVAILAHAYIAWSSR